MSPVDLHLHSTASDGTLPPSEVVRRAAEAGVDGVALTDHDTVSGLEEAEEAAEHHGLRFLRGAELSANEPGRSVHVLAYGIAPDDPELGCFLEAYRRDRVRRAREIVSRLNELDVPLGYEAVERQASSGVPTRAHVARALVEEGLVPDERTVFRRYLSEEGPAYVEKKPTPPEEVFRRVHAAGGVAVLAHPGRTHGPEEIRRWAGEGLDGVEVLHPRNDAGVRQRLDHLADELDLLRSGGSDWHGPRSGRHAEPGSQRVPSTWLDDIERRCRRRRESSTRVG